MKSQAKIKAALGFGKSPHFPMKFREFLRRMFGGRLHADRLRLFRKFAFQELLGQEKLKEIRLSPEALAAAVVVTRDQLVADLNRDGLHDANWYFHTNERVSEWRKSNRRQQRRDANKNRWLKEERKKLLRLLKRRLSDISQAEKCRFAKPKGKKVTGSHRKK